MKKDLTSPDSDSLMVAFNGSIVGFVLEADDEAGYIIQASWGPEIDFLRTSYDSIKAEPVRRVRREGKVAFIGNCETDDRGTLIKNLNKHRADCGLPPYDVDV